MTRAIGSWRALLGAQGLIPALALSFLGESLDARITATGGANGTRVNSAGIIVPASCPRFDYDPMTLLPMGVLVEEQITNSFLQSGDISNAAWAKVTGTPTGASKVAPDGSNSGTLFVPNNTATASRVTQSLTTTAATTYTVSMWLAPGGRTSWIILAPAAFFTDAVNRQATFNLTGIGSVSGILGTGANATIKQWPNGWYRCTLTFTADNATTVAIQFRDGGTGDGVSGVYMWGAQAEPRAFATSYIPTAGAAVTRTADSLIMTGANFSSWFNPTQGTFISEADIFDGTVNRFVVNASDGTNTNEIGCYAATGVNNLITASGVAQGNSLGGSVSANTPFKDALAYATNDLRGVLNGALLPLDTSIVLPVVDRLNFGRRGNNTFILNGHVRRLRYYNTRLADALMQTLTT